VKSCRLLLAFALLACVACSAKLASRDLGLLLSSAVNEIGGFIPARQSPCIPPPISGFETFRPPAARRIASSGKSALRTEYRSPLRPRSVRGYQAMTFARLAENVFVVVDPAAGLVERVDDLTRRCVAD